MVSRARLKVVVALAGLVAATAFLTDAVQHQYWASLVFGALVAAGCLAFLVRLQLPVVADPPPAANPPGSDGGFVASFADHVPMPLLQFGDGKGLAVVNRAARSLFQTDDAVIDPPAELVEAIQGRDQNLARPVRIFGRTYAVVMNEIVAANTTMLLICLADIQSEVRVAEATALRDLLRVLSHEIMNSLTPVSSLARIARGYIANEKSEEAQAAREALDVLAQRASGLARFVEAYRAMARLPEPLVRRLELAPLLTDIVRVFERSVTAADIELELELPEDAPALDVDETLLSQALLNLLKNAAEASEDVPGRRRVRLSLSHDRDEARILISDNGCGVPDDLADQMFHAFVTTKPDGSGTGLNLARQIALAHGGDLVFMGRIEPWSSVFCFILRTSPRLLGAD